MSRASNAAEHRGAALALELCEKLPECRTKDVRLSSLQAALQVAAENNHPRRALGGFASVSLETHERGPGLEP